MSRVFAFVPYTAAFTPALLKYRAKIERSMITNPTCVKMRNFSAAYRRVGAPPMPHRKNKRKVTRSHKNPKNRGERANKTPSTANSRDRESADDALGQSSRCPRATVSRDVSR